jgi:Zn-dependent peptidase ImmA (M78 family)
MADDTFKAELQAATVLKDLGISTLRVDPFEIAKRRDIEVMENPSMNAGVSGCLMKVADTFGILYSAKFASEGFKRFTVAHELGHYFLEGHVHHLFGHGETLHQSESGFTSKNPIEREADAFAAALLMPKTPFKQAISASGTGLAGIETLAEECGTSLTATSIRYATLSDDPIAIICSSGNTIHFATLSKALRERRDLTWIRKGTTLSAHSTTAVFNRDADNVLHARRTTGSSDLGDWFIGGKGEVYEEIVGLGEYGRTLTILHVDDIDDRDASEDVSEDADEMLLPSQRFYRRTRY